MPVAEQKNLVPLVQAAEELQVSVKTLRYWLVSKELTRYQQGYRIFVDIEEARQLATRKREIRRVD